MSNRTEASCLPLTLSPRIRTQGHQGLNPISSRLNAHRNTDCTVKIETIVLFSCVAGAKTCMLVTHIMTSLNGNIFRVTGPFVRGIHRSLWALMFFYMLLNKRLSKQSRRRWLETPSRSLWRHCNGLHGLFDSPYRKGKWIPDIFRAVILASLWIWQANTFHG